MVLPFIALVVILGVLFGKALYEYIQVTHAANEGARLAAVNAPPSTSPSSLGTFLHNEFALPTGASIAICYPTGKRTVGEPVEIDVYTDASWLSTLSLGQIRAAATMRIEQDTTDNGHLDATTTFDSSKGRCAT